MNDLKPGDVVVIQTKHYGTKTGVIIEPWFSPLGTEWLVKPFDHKRNIICQSCDLTVVQRAYEPMDEDGFIQAGITAREVLKNIKQEGGE